MYFTKLAAAVSTQNASCSLISTISFLTTAFLAGSKHLYMHLSTYTTVTTGLNKSVFLLFTKVASSDYYLWQIATLKFYSFL